MFIHLEPSTNCNGRCYRHFTSSWTCQCNYACEKHNDCCPDFVPHCKLGGERYTFIYPNNRQQPINDILIFHIWCLLQFAAGSVTICRSFVCYNLPQWVYYNLPQWVYYNLPHVLLQFAAVLQFSARFITICRSYYNLRRNTYSKSKTSSSNMVCDVMKPATYNTPVTNMLAQ